jgi:DNA-binding response OmpR family regulator
MDGRGETILVAEDYVRHHKRLAYVLKQARYKVYRAGDGNEAVKRMFNVAFDAVVMDWDMPRLKGSKFLCVSRILWPKTPVIVISTHHVHSRTGFLQGAFAWLSKPYGAEELLQLLRAAVQAAGQRNREQSISQQNCRDPVPFIHYPS